MEPSRLVADFERHLVALHARHAGRPWDEMRALWRLALERERIVTVAYRRDVIEGRLARMPVAPEVARAVARAVRWAWRDEEMHALWIRGALLRREPFTGRVRTLLTSLEGRVAGWTSSRQAHFTWSEAPLTRLGAELLELAGVLGGRIPLAARGALQHQPFRDFCRFNVAAETTAALGWARMAELGEGLCDPADVVAFRSIEADERRHAAIFTLLAESFDADDRLVPTVTVPELLEAIGQRGQRFLERPRPGAPAWRNPLGKGAPVHVVQGRAPGALEPALEALLQSLGVARRLQERRGLRVAIKATFMHATRRDDPSPAVGVPLLRALARRLDELGARVSVLEARNLYDRFHEGRTVVEVARWLGLQGPFEVVDAQQDQVPHDFLRGLGQDTIARTWRDADLRIVLGKLRSHPTTRAMLTLEAAEGLGGRHDQHVFGDRKIERETATLMLLDAFPPDLALLDAWSDVPHGLMGMLGSPDVLRPLRLYGSGDAVALDATAATHLGEDPEDEAMLVSSALDWFGDPRPFSRIEGAEGPIEGWRGPGRGMGEAVLTRVALPVFRHGSGRGRLFVPPMDEAFPRRQPEGRAEAALRRAVRAVTAPRDRGAAELLPTTRVRVEGAALRLARLGEGPPLLLLHGYPETLQVFCRLAPLLASAHEVVAFDWPGLGRSAPWPGSADPDALAGQVLRVADALGLERFGLLATDMGGPPALLCAARHPERVARVVVCNSLLFGDAPTSPEIAFMRRVGLARAAFRLAPAVVYRRCMATFLPPGERLPEAIDADFRGAFRVPAVRERLAQMCEDYERALPGLPEDWWRVAVPVRLVWAEDDAHFPVAHARRLAGLLPGVEVVQVPAAGHWMVLTRARAVHAAVAAFLEGPWTS